MEFPLEERIKRVQTVSYRLSDSGRQPRDLAKLNLKDLEVRELEWIYLIEECV